MNDQGAFKVNFFISHKSEYKKAARGLKQILDRYGGRDVEVSVSENIPAGTNWFEWIRERLQKSNVLLLLFTEETASWDWPLYEAGLFTRLDGDDHRKVVCLHHPELEPPKPLRHLQAVPAKPPELSAFLKSLFGTTKITGLEEPINPALAADDETLAREARQICEYFMPRDAIRRKRHYDRFVDIHVADPSKITPDSIPDEATVDSNSRTLACFGLPDGPALWGDIARKAQESGEDEWLKAVAHAVHQAARGNLPDPVFKRFRSRQSGVILRPDLFRSDVVSNGSQIFHLLLLEELESTLTDVPDAVKVLATSLKFAFRFRWEVMERFCHDDLTEEQIDELEGTMGLIEAEASALGLTDQSLLEAQFEGMELRRVQELFRSWAQIRKEDGTGSLDRALQEKDARGVHRILCDLKPLNSEYVELVAKRFADLHL